MGSEPSAGQGWASKATGMRISPFYFSFLLFESFFCRSGVFSPTYFQEKVRRQAQTARFIPGSRSNCVECVNRAMQLQGTGT